MNIIGRRYIFLAFSGALVLISWFALLNLGLRPGIELQGGTQWHIAFATSTDVTEQSLQATLGALPEHYDIQIKRADDGGFILRFPDIGEETHQTYAAALQSSFGDFNEKNFASIGPSIGAELRTQSLWAIAAVLFGISLYIVWAFRKLSQPVRSWKYGIVTLLTLIHDVSIPAGLLAYLGWAYGIEIDTNFIVALLVVMGFSVHDTIVVFDRIREHLLARRGERIDLGVVVNESVNETITRSINTSATLIIMLLALIFVGPASLFYFILTILVGTIMGTYSSIFVASPLLYLWGKR